MRQKERMVKKCGSIQEHLGENGGKDLSVLTEEVGRKGNVPILTVGHVTATILISKTPLN